MRRIAVLATLGIASFGFRAPADAAESPVGGAAALVEKEFFAAIRSVTPAAVFCVAPKSTGISPGSSGVLITKSGYVLSDGDVGAHFDRRSRAEPQYADEVEVRIPDLKRGTYAAYLAKVVKRVKGIDSTLLKIQKPPTSGFPFVVPGTSESLEIGQFTFAMGTAFGQGDGGNAALTAGIVASLVPAAAGQSGGRFAEIETSAAINPGVNGGPLVDVDGNLVGIISSWGDSKPANPFQFLGKAYPIDRIRDAYRELPEAAAIFPDPKALPPKAKNAALLERAFALAARKVSPAVVSLELGRSEPFHMKVPTQRGEQELARYAGPVSGVSVSKDGWIVSSLYNFANVTTLASLGARNDIEETVQKVTSVTAHYPDGTSVPAKVVAHDQRIGIVCLKAEWPAGRDAPVPEVASATDSVRVGRLLVNVGNPFGGNRVPDPLTTIGVLSRIHPADADETWRGNIQTDSGMTDGNCGGAIVDIHGRIVALAMLWNPAAHGRESGIGFGIPWATIEAALPPLEAGTSVIFGGGWLGIKWAPDGTNTSVVKITEVVPDGPAAKAGIEVGDIVTAVEGKPIKRMFDAIIAIRTRRPGDKLVFTVDRAGKRLDLTVELGKRPG